MSEVPHTLYRFYDGSGQLLYVGITLDPGARWKAHSKDKPWWTLVASVTLEQHPNRGTVLRAERAAIIEEHPIHNVIYNQCDQNTERPLDLFERMTDWPGWGSQADDMPDVCHDGCFHSLRIIGGGIYYPYVWYRGLATYECTRGHTWTCKWGHTRSGQTLENAGKNQDPANTHEVTS